MQEGLRALLVLSRRDSTLFAILPARHSSSFKVRLLFVFWAPVDHQGPAGRSLPLLPSAPADLALHITTASPTKPAWLMPHAATHLWCQQPLHSTGGLGEKSCLGACWANGRQMLLQNFSAFPVHPAGPPHPSAAVQVPCRGCFPIAWP